MKNIIMIVLIITTFIPAISNAGLVEDLRSKSIQHDFYYEQIFKIAKTIEQELGRGISRAIEQYRLNAELGDSLSQFVMGLAYKNGDGVKRDLNQAFQWFQKASEQGHAKAQYYLGVAYSEGLGIAKDSVKAMQSFKQAADSGDARAQGLMGLAYLYGIGVPPNPAKAYQWLSLAATNEDTGLIEARDRLFQSMPPEAREEAQKLIMNYYFGYRHP